MPWACFKDWKKGDIYNLDKSGDYSSEYSVKDIKI